MHALFVRNAKGKEKDLGRGRQFICIWSCLRTSRVTCGLDELTFSLQKSALPSSESEDKTAKKQEQKIALQQFSPTNVTMR